jgi:3-oxoacyl-[acyl-carrier-protein] synthase-3
VTAAASADHVWQDPRASSLLGMGRALPGNAISTGALLTRLRERFGIDVVRTGGVIARRLGIDSRHISRNLAERAESPRAGDTNAELAARALRGALAEAGLRADELAYLIGHTTTPGQLAPPNIARVADLIGYDGPYLELRQACTGFANALVVARGLLDAPGAGPVAIVGSETGSVYFDPLRAAEDHGQLVNLVQMGDAAAACIVGARPQRGGALLSRLFFGQIGRGKAQGFRLQAGGSDVPQAAGSMAEFTHDFAAVRRHGPELFRAGLAAATQLDIDSRAVDYLIPHQANGRMAQLLATETGVDARRVFVNADRVGNTGSAAIWLALAELREQLKPGQRVLVLGAEATQHMFGGFLYEHG